MEVRNPQLDFVFPTKYNLKPSRPIESGSQKTLLVSSPYSLTFILVYKNLLRKSKSERILNPFTSYNGNHSYSNGWIFSVYQSSLLKIGDYGVVILCTKSDSELVFTPPDFHYKRCSDFVFRAGPNPLTHTIYIK